jgi:MazG family protein
MQEPSALGRIVDLVRDLRKRCPWDAAQTPESLRTYLVEEVLELDHAIATGDQDDLRTELGDVLLHVAFQIVLAEEQGLFGAEDLTRAVEEKMWRRHPHLYGDKDTATNQPTLNKEQVAERWERIKRRESAAPSSIVDGLPPNLPALLMAFRLQERAAGVGFDWPDTEGPRQKVSEELEELRSVDRDDDAAEREEVGDLLFAVVNLARKLGVDPRAALEQANAKFGNRFRRVEQLAVERGIEIGHADLETLDGLWNEAKKEG